MKLFSDIYLNEESKDNIFGKHLTLKRWKLFYKPCFSALSQGIGEQPWLSPRLLFAALPDKSQEFQKPFSSFIEKKDSQYTN